MAGTAVAVEVPSPASQGTPSVSVAGTTEPASLWHYGAYADVSYVLNFNFPKTIWRSRSTAVRHNELAPNMGLVYIRKDTTTDSRWGMEFGLQGGYDSKNFHFCKVGQGRRRGYLAPSPSGERVVSGPGGQRPDDDGWSLQQFDRLRIALRQRQCQLHPFLVGGQYAPI
ncbi:MAG: hypothetical protein U0361_15000 [Nitrospiraceae bacterium]